MQHDISRTIVSGNGVKVVRATCSCGRFKSEAKRLSTPDRRRLDREVAEHLASVETPLQPELVA